MTILTAQLRGSAINIKRRYGMHVRCKVNSLIIMRVISLLVYCSVHDSVFEILMSDFMTKTKNLDNCTILQQAYINQLTVFKPAT